MKVVSLKVSREKNLKREEGVIGTLEEYCYYCEEWMSGRCLGPSGNGTIVSGYRVNRKALALRCKLNGTARKEGEP